MKIDTAQLRIVKIGVIILSVMLILAIIFIDYGLLGVIVTFLLIAVFLALYDYKYRPESERKKK